MDYYGQHGEDFLVHALLGDGSDRFFVDIGAFDGVHLSNSRALARAGWSGICVEAHPGFFGHLQRNRPDAINVHAACVGAGAGSTVTFKCEELGLLSGITPEGTADLAGRYARRGMIFRGFETVTVPAVTLNDLLATHAGDRRHIDLLSIDTEGNEAEILADFDFGRWAVAVVIVEANTDDDRARLVDLMRRRGYGLARRVDCNLLFARRPADILFLRHKRLTCRIADTLHPLGEPATPRAFRGRVLDDRRPWLGGQILVQAPGQPLGLLADWFPAPLASAPEPRPLVIVPPEDLGAARYAGEEALVAVVPGDVRLAPTFATAVTQLIGAGFQGLAIASQVQSGASLPPALAAVAGGLRPFGLAHDVLVFPPALLGGFDMDFVGDAGPALLLNLLAQAGPILALTDTALATRADRRQAPGVSDGLLALCDRLAAGDAALVADFVRQHQGPAELVQRLAPSRRG